MSYWDIQKEKAEQAKLEAIQKTKDAGMDALDLVKHHTADVAVIAMFGAVCGAVLLAVAQALI